MANQNIINLDDYLFVANKEKYIHELAMACITVMGLLLIFSTVLNGLFTGMTYLAVTLLLIAWGVATYTSESRQSIKWFKRQVYGYDQSNVARYLWEQMTSRVETSHQQYMNAPLMGQNQAELQEQYQSDYADLALMSYLRNQYNQFWFD